MSTPEADRLGSDRPGTALSWEAHGYGERRPVAPNVRDGRDNPAGRARNRRVEIRFDR